MAWRQPLENPEAEAEPGLPRRRDAERTRLEIIEVAIREFARRGYSGARVDQIAAQTRTTKRMIYYYFGSKKGLYIAALERSYQNVRNLERGIDVEHLAPVAAIRRLAELTFDHHESHPDFIRLVTVENIHHAEQMAESEVLSQLSHPVLNLISRILEQGRAEGVFSRKTDAVDVHMLISALCFFRMANRYTFGTLFNRDLVDPALRDHYRAMVGDVIVEYLTSNDT